MDEPDHRKTRREPAQTHTLNHAIVLLAIKRQHESLPALACTEKALYAPRVVLRVPCTLHVELPLAIVEPVKSEPVRNGVERQARGTHKVRHGYGASARTRQKVDG